MNRRDFLRTGVAGALCAGGALRWAGLPSPSAPRSWSATKSPAPLYSVIPIVGDGKWVWTDPPPGKTGYLDPRSFDLQVGIRVQGTGPATQLRATTAVPLELPEQKIDAYRVDTHGCRAGVRRLGPEMAQLLLAADSLSRGEVVAAAVQYRLTLYKTYHGYQREQFPAVQEFDKPFHQAYMYDSPGIQTRNKEVRKLSADLGASAAHPWDKARAYFDWTWENIKPRVGYYTSVIAALRARVGDCEERATVFIALCRAAGIPARLVVVPSHCWAEFCLKDEDGRQHWIPAHTAAYIWFGWTGAHEVVLQKGDKVYVPEKKKPTRVIPDWLRCYGGSRPNVHYFAELRPLPSRPGGDPGPGARSKDLKGEWRVTGEHPLDPQLRDGRRTLHFDGRRRVAARG